MDFVLFLETSVWKHVLYLVPTVVGVHSSNTITLIRLAHAFFMVITITTRMNQIYVEQRLEKFAAGKVSIKFLRTNGVHVTHISFVLHYNLFSITKLVCIVSIESKTTTTSTRISQTFSTTTTTATEIKPPINKETTTTGKYLVEGQVKAPEKIDETSILATESNTGNIIVHLWNGVYF